MVDDFCFTNLQLLPSPNGLMMCPLCNWFQFGQQAFQFYMVEHAYIIATCFTTLKTSAFKPLMSMPFQFD